MTKTRIGIVIAILLIISGTLILVFKLNHTQSAMHYRHIMKVGNQTLYLDIATSTTDMAQGLSDRLRMNNDQGMLFDFKSSQLPTFWMKDMNFALDFLWISNNKIVGITPNAPAAPKNSDGSFNDNNLPLYSPPSPVDEVLEVNANWAQKNNITVGDAVK